MSKYCILFIFPLVFISLVYWARLVMNRLGTAIEAFLIYTIPVIFVAPFVATLVVYLSVN